MDALGVQNTAELIRLRPAHGRELRLSDGCAKRSPPPVVLRVARRQRRVYYHSTSMGAFPLCRGALHSEEIGPGREGAVATCPRCVLLADDHPNMLEAVRGLLQGRFAATVMVADEPSLIEAVMRMEPDLVVVDLSLPVTGGVNVVRALLRRYPGFESHRAQRPPRRARPFPGPRCRRGGLRPQANGGGRPHCRPSRQSSAVRFTFPPARTVSPHEGGRVLCTSSVKERPAGKPDIGGRRAGKPGLRQTDVSLLLAEVTPAVMTAGPVG